MDGQVADHFVLIVAITFSDTGTLEGKGGKFPGVEKIRRLEMMVAHFVVGADAGGLYGDVDLAFLRFGGIKDKGTVIILEFSQYFAEDMLDRESNMAMCLIEPILGGIDRGNG